jgi:chorismate synthase
LQTCVAILRILRLFDGAPRVVRVRMRLRSTLQKPLGSVNLRTGEATQAHVTRSDVCADRAAAVIAESLLCVVLADAILEKSGGDSMAELLPRVEA